MNRPRNQFTIYHMMDMKGHFDSNPANQQARDSEGQGLYKGPVEYPKMLYHPQGAQKVISPERVEPSPIGPITIPAQLEVIHQIVQNAKEEEALVSKGWHRHPSGAIVAAGGEAPPISPAQIISEQDAEIKRLRDLLAKGKAPSKAEEKV